MGAWRGGGWGFLGEGRRFVRVNTKWGRRGGGGGEGGGVGTVGAVGVKRKKEYR